MGRGGRTIEPARRALPSLLAGCAATALAAGACARQVDLGQIGDGSANLLWSATFEPGNLSEWNGDGQGGGYLENIAVAPSVTSDIAHNGHYAGKATVMPASGMASINYFFRQEPSPISAYYAAWFYIDPSFTVKTWLSLIHFRGSHTGDGRNVFPTWDVNLYPRLDGSLIAHLYNYVTGINLEQTTPIPVPVGQWVHFELYFRKASDPTGRVAVWQDDVPILDWNGVATVENDWNQWSVGGSSNDVDPCPRPGLRRRRDHQPRPPGRGGARRGRGGRRGRLTPQPRTRTAQNRDQDRNQDGVRHG